MSILQRQWLLDMIEEIISPYVGPNLAQASTRVHCEKLGLLADTVTVEQGEAMVDLLARALRVFIGNDKTSDLVQQMHDRIKEKSRNEN